MAGTTSSGTNPSCLPTDHSFDANVYTYLDSILGKRGTDETTTCGGLPPAGDAQVEVLGFDGRLDDAVPSTTHTVNVDAGKNSARFGLNAFESVRVNSPEPTFDVNMYVKAGPGASATDFDCKADTANVFGACVFDLPAAGTYSVFIQRALGEGDYQLTVTIFGGAAPVCGDGNLDFNEQCDDGNNVGGDCCDASCRYEPSGSPCPPDGAVCTDDVCDSAGKCGVFNTEQCGSPTPTATPPATETSTATASASPSATRTPTSTATPTSSATPTASATLTHTATPSPTATVKPTDGDGDGCTVAPARTGSVWWLLVPIPVLLRARCRRFCAVWWGSRSRSTAGG